MTVVKVPISDSDPGVYAEFDVKDKGEWRFKPLGDGKRSAAVAGHSLAASLNSVLPALSEIFARLRSAATGSDEMTLQFGLRVGGQTGLVFVSGGADATIGVTVTWRKPEATATPPDPTEETGAGTDDGA
jgi:hypothetical protein